MCIKKEIPVCSVQLQPGPDQGAPRAGQGPRPQVGGVVQVGWRGEGRSGPGSGENTSHSRWLLPGPARPSAGRPIAPACDAQRPCLPIQPDPTPQGPPLRALPDTPFSVLESLPCGVWPIATLCHFAAPLCYCLSLGGHGGEAGMTCHRQPIYGSPRKAGWGLRVLSCWSGSEPRRGRHSPKLTQEQVEARAGVSWPWPGSRPAGPLPLGPAGQDRSTPQPSSSRRLPAALLMNTDPPPRRTAG